MKNTKEILGFCDIGDIVVSLTNNSQNREEGDMFKVLDGSSKNNLYYKQSTCSSDVKQWRLATQSEIDAYNQGVRNIKDIKVEEKYKFKKGVWYYYQGTTNYRKSSKYSNKHIEYDERLENAKYEKHKSTAYWGIDKIVEVSLEEIQKYLPEGHIDKECVFGKQDKQPIMKHNLYVGMTLEELNPPDKNIQCYINSFLPGSLLRVPFNGTYNLREYLDRKIRRIEGEYFEIPFQNGWFKISDVIDTKCENCNGEGTVMVGKMYPSGHTEVNEECDECGGSGEIPQECVLGKPSHYPDILPIIVDYKNLPSGGKYYMGIDTAFLSPQIQIKNRNKSTQQPIQKRVKLNIKSINQTIKIKHYV